jgi:Cu/Ag efflux protein CusF
MLGIVLAATALAAEQQAPRRVGGSSTTVTGHATVQAVDLATRHITLRSDDGKSLTIVADEQIKNLAQLHAGDVVDVKYREAVVVDVLPEGAGASVTAEGSAKTAKPGARPGAAAARRVTIVATIEAIDEASHYVTLRGPEGNSFDVKAQNPANLKKVKVGDVVRITYTEAVAISVRKPGS